MKPPIGIGVLSLAHGHVSLYADVMKDFPDVRLLAACDDNPERARPVCERTGMRYESRVEGVLDDPAVQAVMIGSETSRHAALCIAAAEAGKHILLQKPMAMTLEECDRMNASAAAHGVTLAMAWQMRHDPANIKMRDLVQSGALGTIGVVRRRHCIPVLFNAEFINGPTNWHVRAETNIGMFADDAAHPIDWLCWTFGKPASVMAEIDNVLTHAAPDDNGIALFRLAGGAMATDANTPSRPGSRACDNYPNLSRVAFHGYHSSHKACREVARYLSSGIARTGPFELLPAGRELPVFAFKIAEDAQN